MTREKDETERMTIVLLVVLAVGATLAAIELAEIARRRVPDDQRSELAELLTGLQASEAAPARP